MAKQGLSGQLVWKKNKFYSKEKNILDFEAEMIHFTFRILHIVNYTGYHNFSQRKFIQLV